MESAVNKLPEGFVARMRADLLTDADAFFSCYDRPAAAGIRLNTKKLSPDDLPFPLGQIPWTNNGYYIDKDAPAAKHPYFFAGGYYIQEPSAMLPAALLPVSPGDIILDLCAAPGGKATELALRLDGKGLLIANDASASRAKALLKNLTKWGVPNCCVSAETPGRLLDAFGCCFDKILVDAPCSGEGMFRKDRSLIRSWEEKGPESYVPLQKEILSCAVKMLKPGGMLLYSTCTFSREEDEGVISQILSENPDLMLVQPEWKEGYAHGRGSAPLDRCIRLYPHLARGEGQFAALLCKKGDSGEAVQNSLPDQNLPLYPAEEVQKSKETMPQAVRAFLNRMPNAIPADYRYEQINSQCLLIPPYRLPKLRWLRTGIALGSVKETRFIPSQALALLLTKEKFDAVLDLSLSDERLLRCLKGESVPLTESEQADLKDSEDGRVLICAGGLGLCWGKYAGASLKNKIEPGWRMQ